MLGSLQRLLEPRDRLPVGRVGEGLYTGLPKVAQGAVPELRLPSMVGQPFDVLAEPIRVKALDALHDACVHLPATLVQEGPLRDLPGEPVLEHVLRLREKPALVEELARP